MVLDVDNFSLIIGIWLLVRLHNRQIQIFILLFATRIYKAVKELDQILWYISLLDYRLEPAFSKASKNFRRRRYTCLSHSRYRIITLRGNRQLSGWYVMEELDTSCHKWGNLKYRMLLNWFPACLFFSSCLLYLYHLSLVIGILLCRRA